jgi:hypothetical protein
MTGSIVTPAGLLRMLVLTLRDPGQAARQLISLNLSRIVLWQALALVTVVSVIVTALAPEAAMQTITTGEQETVLVTPLAFAAIMGSLLVILVFALYHSGLSLGGTGTFPATLVLVVWLEVLATAVRSVLSLALIVSPVIAGILSLGALAVLLRTLVSFIDVLHGFQSFGKALMTLVLAAVGAFFGLSLILTVISLVLTGGSADV